MYYHDFQGGFHQQYSVYPVAMMPQSSCSKLEDMETKGYIVLPPSALSKLAQLEVQLPMVFKLINEEKKRESHSGVLEFVAEEGKLYMPYWMMKNLQLEVGDPLKVSNVSLPSGAYACFQPQSPDFLDITDPKAVLEKALRSFSCLSQEDIISVHYNNKQYQMRILETKPGNAIKIIECDLQVDFAEPLGYGKTENVWPSEKEVTPTNNTKELTFKGNGFRVDGKNHKVPKEVMGNTTEARNATSDDNILEHKAGFLKFHSYKEIMAGVYPNN